MLDRQQTTDEIVFPLPDNFAELRYILKTVSFLKSETLSHSNFLQKTLETRQ